MLHIVKQIKSLYKILLLNSFINPEDAINIADIADTNNTGKIDGKELNALLRNDNSDLSRQKRVEAKKAFLALGGGVVDKQEFIDILSGQETEIKVVKTEYKKEKTNIFKSIGDIFKSFGSSVKAKEVNKSTKESVDKFNFTETLRKGARGEQVKALQAVLGIKADGVFGKGTERAVQAWQAKNGLHTDGIIGKNGREVLNNTNEKYISKGAVENGSAMNEHIGNTENIQTYINAYNDIYGNAGEKSTKLISDHTGVWGIVQRMESSDLERLERKLGIKLQGTSEQSEQLASKLGITEGVNSPRFKEKMTRMAVVATISAIVSAIASGGNQVYVTVELFGINHKAVGDLLGVRDVGVTFSKGVSASRIASLMLGEQVDMKQSFKDALVAKDTTDAGLKNLADLYNNADMDTADLKRIKSDILPKDFVKGILNFLSYGFFEALFGEHLAGVEGSIRKLINQFEKNPNIDNLIKTLQGIYTSLVKVHKEHKIEMEEQEKAFANYSARYNKKMNGNSKSLNALNQALGESTGDDSIGEHESYEMSKDNLKAARINFEKSGSAMKEIGDMIGKYSKIGNKLSSINNETFDKTSAIEGNKQTDKKITEVLASFGLSRAENLHSLSSSEINNLNSKASFGYNIDMNQLSDNNYMKGEIQKLINNSKTGEYSMLAEAIRGTKQLKDVPFSEQEFIEAFIKTAQVEPDKKYVVSNLGTMRNAQQQGKLSGELFSITINETKFYFHETCNNPVSIVEEDGTTTQSTSDTPVVKTFKVRDKKEKPTERPTEEPTEEPTERATERPTERVTERPTERVTERPTERVTERPTTRPTDSPTRPPRPTETPTETPTTLPTDSPTLPPRPTETPTTLPTDSPTLPPRPTVPPTVSPEPELPTTLPTTAPTIAPRPESIDE